MAYKRYILSVDDKERTYIGYSFAEIIKLAEGIANDNPDKYVLIVDKDGNIYFENKPIK